MEDILKQLSDIDLNQSIDYTSLMLDDVYNIEKCYLHMLKGNDFELHLSDDPNYQYIDKDELGDFIRNNCANVIRSRLSKIDENLLNTIIDYYLAENFM